jgi:lysyl-tRNA synthetase class 2
MDYPKEAAALARCVGTEEIYAERWELYVNGVELANAYSELTDAAEQRNRFEQCAEKRASRNQVIYPIDEVFLEALSHISEAGGAALGVDRLLLWLLDKDTLDEVLPFREVWT